MAVPGASAIAGPHLPAQPAGDGAQHSLHCDESLGACPHPSPTPRARHGSNSIYGRVAVSGYAAVKAALR